MTSPSPGLAKAIRIALVGSGALAIISALVNALAAYQLIEAAEEASLGITRREILGWYGGMAVIGIGLVYLGLRRRK